MGRTTLPSLALVSKNSAPSYASAAEHTTVHSIPHDMNTLSFIVIFYPFHDILPIKKHPESLSYAFGLERQDASD